MNTMHPKTGITSPSSSLNDDQFGYKCRQCFEKMGYPFLESLVMFVEEDESENFPH